MTPEQLREWAGAIEGEKPWAPKVADVCDQLREHAAALEEIERLKVLVAEAPWQRTGVDDWRCRECWATVCRGIYPTAFGHAAHCSHSIRDVVDRAEKAEQEVERLKVHAEAMAVALDIDGERCSPESQCRVCAILDAYRAEFKDGEK